MSGHKLGHEIKLKEKKTCVHYRDLIFSPIIMKHGQNLSLMKARMNLIMGHVVSKTTSLGQMLEKPCVCSRGHIFSQIIMKLGQNFCFDEISHEYENGSCQVKN